MQICRLLLKSCEGVLCQKVRESFKNFLCRVRAALIQRKLLTFSKKTQQNLVCNTKVSHISSLKSCNEERNHGNVKREKTQ
jgi:hypothetical protein